MINVAKRQISRNATIEEVESAILLSYKSLSINELIDKTFTRGYRWRPDNGLSIWYYTDYNEPGIIINGDDLGNCSCFALLINAGWEVWEKLPVD